MTAPVSLASEERFSDRVENYIRYRPSYPLEIVSLLKDQAGLTQDSIIADVGSGTGISAAMFLKTGYSVQAVEPNRQMREAAERLLAGYPAFVSVNGSAQATTLPAQSVDLIVAAQAFHWFNTPETRAEFNRILKPEGKVALIWNERQLDATPFLHDYEHLLVHYATDYGEVRHENIQSAELSQFFRGDYSTHTFDNAQHFDFEGIEGRLLSSSYTPTKQSPKYTPMREELRRIFDLHQRGGQVEISYFTKVYIGR